VTKGNLDEYLEIFPNIKQELIESCGRHSLAPIEEGGVVSYLAKYEKLYFSEIDFKLQPVSNYYLLKYQLMQMNSGKQDGEWRRCIGLA
jgi:hypothetical protein